MVAVFPEALFAPRSTGWAFLVDKVPAKAGEGACPLTRGCETTLPPQTHTHTTHTSTAPPSIHIPPRTCTQIPSISTPTNTHTPYTHTHPTCTQSITDTLTPTHAHTPPLHLLHTSTPYTCVPPPLHTRSHAHPHMASHSHGLHTPSALFTHKHALTPATHVPETPHRNKHSRSPATEAKRHGRLTASSPGKLTFSNTQTLLSAAEGPVGLPVGSEQSQTERPAPPLGTSWGCVEGQTFL